MENEGNPRSDASPSDASRELPSEILLVVAHEGAGDAQDAHGDPNPTLEIVIDGSDLLSDGVRRDGLELSILFEKNNGEEGLQSDLADQLDGVEVRVSLDSTQTMGVEVLSSHHRDRAILQTEDLQLSLEGSQRDVSVLDGDGAHTLPVPNPSDWSVENDVHMENHTPTSPALNSANGFAESEDVKEECVSLLPKPDPHIVLVESDNVVENCNKEDENKSNEKKRSREELVESGRCLKSKTMEGSKTEELGELASNITVAEEHSEPVQIDEVSVLNPLHAETTKISSGMVLEDHETNGKKLRENVKTTSGVDSVFTDVTDFQAKEACNGLGTNDNTCNKESTVKASDASVEGSVCDKDNRVDAGRERPRKKRKIAMLLAYCGAGYQGMQKNPGAVTIEGELEQALVKAGAMPENFDGNPRKVDWMRAARTDKGVSAVGQVVSGLFYVDPPGFVERVNAHLPQQIRLLGFKRVTPTFNAKKFCDRRRYEYVIPTFALDPSAHRDREAVLASEGKEDALIKCLECSERGRKIPAGKGSGRVLPNKVESGMGNMCDGQNLSAHGTINEDGVSSISEEPHEESTSLEPKLSTAMDLNDSALILENKGAKQSCLDDVSEPTKETFHFGEADRTNLNRLLNYYVGTHNFHNFTSRVKAEDPSAKRYVVSFEVGDVFTVGNMEFVRCTVVGQSFMLHQIRKMIGLAVAVFRGCAPESILETALRRDANITIPTAPELGLFLDECMYPAYNQKWYTTHEEVSQKGYEPEISRFKHEVIYEHIAATEHKDGQMALFLHSLNDRNYADFVTAREAEKQLVQ